MAQKPLSDEQCEEVLAALETHKPQTAAAESLGIPRETFQARLKTATSSV